MTPDNALKIILDLARQNVLDERDTRKEPDLEAQRIQQEAAIEAVELEFLTRKTLAKIGKELASMCWQGLPEPLTRLIMDSRKAQGWKGKRLRQ